MEEKTKRTRPDLAERNKANAKHGKTNSRTWRIWKGMLERCRLKNSKDWSNYGGRGITVDSRWLDFMAFLEDMGEAPDGMSIDRIDNNAGYCRQNCRWATVEQQANNRRTCVMLTFNGKTQSVAEWSREVGVERKTLEYRIRVGWNAADALTTKSLIPRKKHGNQH
jgi:hypothetical protein